MTLTVATLLPGLFLALIGALFLISSSAVVSAFKALPRSTSATVLFFGAAALWFLYRLTSLSEADFGEYRMLLLVAFSAIALLSFLYVPDFLAVRGLSALMLLSASPLLDAAYMEHAYPQRKFMVAAVYVGIAAAIYFAAVPFRLRDFFNWLFARPARPRVLGGVMATYGLLLTVLAFSY